MISWLGNFEESPSNPKRYDAYHNTVDGCSYIYDGANWTLLASKGDKGETGSSGADGRSIVWKGTFYSHPENPQELWTYYNATDGNAYIYSNGSWSLLMQNLAVNYDTPTIIGTVSSNGDMYSVSDVYIKVVDESSSNTVWNSLPAADGDFAVSGLDASRTYTLHFSSKRLSDVNITNSKALAATTEDASFGAVRTNVTPLSGKAQNLGSIVLSPNGTVHGSVVLGGDSNTNEGVDVFLNGTPYATKTDSNGEYTIKDVLQGSYSIVFRKDGYITQSRDMVVFSSNPSEVPSIEVPSVRLVMGSCTLKGTVGYEDRTDMSGINVVLMDSNGDVCRTSMTEKGGSFSFEGLSPDTYTIRAGADGYTTVDRRISISMGESYVVPMESLVNLCGSITGSVTTNDSGLKSGVKVKAASSSGGLSYEATTDEAGLYTLSNVLHGDYVLTFEKDGYETYTTNVTVEPGRTSTADAQLKSRFGSIRVIVSFVDKDDPTGIVVNVYRNGTLIFSATATSTGIIVIVNLPIGDGYSVIASSDGYGSSGEDKVTVSSGTVSELNLQKLSNRYGSIKGRVVDAGGNPIGSATVSISSDDGNSYTLTTSNDGTFSKTDVAVGTYTVSAGKADFLTTTFPQTYTVESSLVTEIKDDIVLTSRYANIEGRVQYADKEDASNISVTIEDDKGRTLGTVVTGGTGSYSFKVESGTYYIRANAQGYFESSKVVNVVSGNEYVVEFEDLKSMYGSVYGKILTSNGSAVEGATIRLESNDGKAYTVSSLADGSFLFENVPIGDYSVSVSKLEFQTVALPLKYSVESSKRTAIDAVVLTSEYADINGFVKYSDRTDHSGILVTIEDSTEKTIDSFTVGSDGTFSFRVSAGTFAIKANADGYAGTSKSITVVVGKTYSIDLGRINTLYGSITGKVVDADGNAVSGAVVNLTNMDGAGDAVTLSTNENGEFSSSIVPIGTYTVSITKSGYIDVVCNDVPIVGGRTYDVGTKALVSGTAGITGRVVLEGASNYSGVTVSATSLTDASRFYTTTTTDDGAYYFMSIESGAYSLKIQKDGYITDSTQQVSLIAGNVSQVKTITLKSESSTVTGSVSLEGSSSSIGVEVLLVSTDNKRFSTTTDYNGRYVFNNVKTGKYELILSKDGYANVSIKDLYVEKGVEKALDAIVMNIAFTSVRGQVSLEGRTDLSGALVTATNISNTDIIYSAITNSQGVFTFAKMYSGEYSIAVSCSGYSTATLPTVNVVDDTPMDVGSVSLKIERGTIAGIARLEGYSDYSGVKVTILGNDYEATTAEDGSYSFTVPAGNYPGGLRFEYGDFETTSYASTIPVLTNSTYAIPDIQMKCLNVPRVYGKVTIYGLTRAEYDGITVKIAELPSFSYTTDKDGVYSFEHVPVGTYTLEFTRENARKVTKIVAVDPSPYIEIEDIELIPDAATLYGNISMDGVADYSGATVRITTPGSVELKTMTNAAGYWYIGNVVASKGHIITFEKEGWDSQSYEIAANRYEPLALVDYNKEQPVVMKDTTAPVITNISANIGRSTENGREVYLYLYTNEKGSGIKWIQGTTSDSFDEVEEQSYYNPFTLLIPDEVGECTLHVRVKDGAGNISDTANTNIVVKNDKVQLSGPLSGEKLHLTKNQDGKPYVITDVVLVPKGETLVIDPGVEIQVQGAFYIQVEGSINAIGTKDDRIKIYGVDAGVDNWKGINFMADSGNVISYADISGMAVGVYGYCDLDHVLLTASRNGYAIGKDRSTYLFGDVRDSEISGAVSTKEGSVWNSRFSECSVYLDGVSVFNCDFLGYVNAEDCFVNNCTFSGSSCFFDSSVSVNNLFEGSSMTVKGCIVRMTTFNNVSLSLSGGFWKNDTLNGCSFSSYSVISLVESNLISCGKITITAKRSDRETLDMRGNYWGDDKTIELDSKTKDDNDNDADLSFIQDYNDKDKSNINASRVLYSGYSNDSIENCGYQGKDYGTTGSYSGYSIGDKGPAGGLVFYDKGFYSDGWRYLEAAPYDIGKFVFGYYRLNGSNRFIVGTSTVFGSGSYNTEVLVDEMNLEGNVAYKDSSGTSVAKYAAKECFDYVYGSCDDWFLPSKEELNLMYENLYKQGLGSFANGFDNNYWSSSEIDAGYYAWDQYFYNGNQGGNSRGDETRVRPVRAF